MQTATAVLCRYSGFSNRPFARGNACAMPAWSYPHVCILHTVSYRRTIDSIRLLAVPDCASLAAAKGFSFAAVQLPADQRGHAAHNHQRRDAPRCCATHPLAPKVLCRHAQLRQAKRSVKSALSNLRCACLLHRCRRDFRAYVHAEQNAIGLVVDGPSLTVIFEYAAAAATTSAAATTAAGSTVHPRTYPRLATDRRSQPAEDRSAVRTFAAVYPKPAGAVPIRSHERLVVRRSAQLALMSSAALLSATGPPS